MSSRTALALVLLLVIAVMTMPLGASTHYWDRGAGNDYWSTAYPTNWSPDSVPGSSDDASIGRTSYYYPANVILDNTTGYCNFLYLGYNRSGTLTIQNGASLQCTNSLHIAELSGGTGTLNILSGQNYCGSLYVGNGADTGTVNHSAGTMTVYDNDETYVGNQASEAIGYYNLSGTGYLTTPVMYIAHNGTGTFTMTGGSLSVRTGNLYVGSQGDGSGGGTGTLTISGGSVSVVGSIGKIAGTGTATISLNGYSSFTFGSQMIADNLYIGQSSGSNPTFAIGSGKEIIGLYEYVGDYGTATINQSAGSNHQPSGSAGDLVLGYHAGGSAPVYNLSGSGSVNFDYQFIGAGKAAVFNQSGGTKGL